MLKGLFLDDERMPEDVKWVLYPKDVDWVIVRDYSEFVEECTSKDFDIVSFDHDLGHVRDYKSGYECVKFLVELLFDEKLKVVPTTYFHSKNPIGKKNMSLYWKNAIKEYKDLCSQY